MAACSRASQWCATIGAGVLLAAVVGCTTRDVERPRPSFFLVVTDTVRYDAVSANGLIAESTPVIDGLAASGLRYANAYAAASWTLPSHASLFTGLLPSAHGIGWPRTDAPDELVMLAETLRDAGYDTVAVSENPWVTDTFNLVQGFVRFKQVRRGGSDLVEFVRDWVRDRSTSQPFFLFVNVLDAHAPYRVEPENPHVPCCLGTDALNGLSTNVLPAFCRTQGRETDLLVQHGLYLNGVTRADAKVGEVLAALAAARATDGLVTIVTSDHGEHFGEHGFVDHVIGVHEELIHVPLIVHGLRGISAGVVDQVVSLLDVVPSVLAWAGLPPSRTAIGRPLPERADDHRPPRVVVSEWHDPGTSTRVDPQVFAANGRRLVRNAQQQCGPPARVHGLMRAAIAFPEKLVWYERFPPALYDLAGDRAESHDLAAELTRRVRLLTNALPPVGTAPAPAPAGRTTSDTLRPDVEEQLRALGYIAPETP